MQRRRLLLAVGELVADGGVEAATAGAISQRAGVSRRTFYEVFEDREACFLAAFEETVERISHDVRIACEGERRWSARVRAGLIALLEHFDAHPGEARVCVVETLRGGPLVIESRGRVLATLVAAIEQGRHESSRSFEPLPLAAEGVVGGALAVIHARLLAPDGRPLVELANPLTGMILHSYLGPAAARRELDRPLPEREDTVIAQTTKDPFGGLAIRFTYRTARVLATIDEHAGASNRLIADSSGISDEGQMSRLLRRLDSAGLIENRGEGHVRGEPNAWWLTERGQAIHATLTGTQTTPA